MEAILREAKMRIEPNGLNDLMDAMKNGMKDPNMMAEYLVNMSMGKGTTDNTTAMVVRLND